MASIVFRIIELIATISELVGYKAGLALNKEELNKFLPEYDELWSNHDDSFIRIRHEEIEETLKTVLYRIGNIPSPDIDLFCSWLRDKYRNNPSKYRIFDDLYIKHCKFFGKAVKQCLSRDSKNIDPLPFILESEKIYGTDGLEIAIEIVDNMVLCSHVSILTEFRRVEWVNAVDLKDLFGSESLNTLYGSFIDQRFIDYLHKNFNDIDNINWRKFEALTCEFFDRNGFFVKIGEGRNDGGIDARIWPKEDKCSLPPTILVQCKRQKKKVGKIVVKSLWADIEEEKANFGLIVTTSAISPGAKKVCTARGYPIYEANRENIHKWIKTMRSPHSGVFLGE